MSEPQPFHAVPGRDERRRLLVLSYHFPPGSSAGSQRWRRLAHYAAERGWALDVVTLDPAGLPSPDRRSLSELPAGVRVFGVAPVEATAGFLLDSLLAVRRRLRQRNGATTAPAPAIAAPRAGATRRPGFLARTYGAWLATRGDAQWAAAVGDVAMQLAARHRYDVVVTCGPPHMVHVAGARVAQARGLRHVMDLRDPWRLVERLADSIDSPWWHWHATWHERRVVPRAALVVMNTVPARDAMRLQYPAAASRIMAVMNGTDDEVVPATQRPRAFLVTYSGSIYLDRDPSPLFAAAARCIAATRATPEDFRIVLVGDVHEFRGTPTIELARRLGIDAFVELRAHCARSEMLALLAQSAVLVSLPQDSNMAIPSKVFEYMQFEAWVLALAEPHSATARLLEGSEADVVAPHDVPGIAAVLGRRFHQFQRGAYPSRLAGLERFGRRAQARLLFEAIEALR